MPISLLKQFTLPDGQSWETRRLPFYIVTIFIVLSALMVSTAYAHSTYVTPWNNLYPGSSSDHTSCQLCHGGSTGDLNPYGLSMALCTGGRDVNTIAARIQADPADLKSISQDIRITIRSLDNDELVVTEKGVFLGPVGR